MVDRDGVLAYNAVRCRCQAVAASWFVRVRVRGWYSMDAVLGGRQTVLLRAPMFPPTILHSCDLQTPADGQTVKSIVNK